jgi:hypothetical protein
MGTKNTIWIISGGTNYYLSGGANTQTVYAGSGTPWTSEATSPYELSLNDATPIWIPTPAPANVLYSGGPPFAIGRQPAYRSFDTITEQVGIQMRATTKDNAIALLRQLRKALNPSALPAVLAVTGGTNTGYTEIYSADVTERPSYLSEPDGIFRAVITWTRAPFFGLLSAGEMLVNAVTMNNTGTGTPDNVESLGTGSGDLINEGSPLNISLTPGSGTIGQLYAASVLSRTYTTSGAAAYSTSATATVSAWHAPLWQTLRGGS